MIASVHRPWRAREEICSDHLTISVAADQGQKSPPTKSCHNATVARRIAPRALDDRSKRKMHQSLYLTNLLTESYSRTCALLGASTVVLSFVCLRSCLCVFRKMFLCLSVHLCLSMLASARLCLSICTHASASVRVRVRVILFWFSVRLCQFVFVFPWCCKCRSVTVFHPDSLCSPRFECLLHEIMFALTRFVTCLASSCNVNGITCAKLPVDMPPTIGRLAPCPQLFANLHGTMPESMINITGHLHNR